MTGRFSTTEQPLSLRLAAISADPLDGLDLTRRTPISDPCPCVTCESDS